MKDHNDHEQLPDSLERERRVLEIIYYVVKITYVLILIVATLFALGGITA